MTDSIDLKWGTLKGWNLESEAAKALMQEYLNLGASAGAMQQHDTDEQKQIICRLIDIIDGPIFNDWSGKYMSKDEARAYVLNHGKGG